MKNQYFGDINDYKKYGLLRSIGSASNLSILVAWMLTPDDGSTDGKFTEYLSQPGKWEGYDSVLYREVVGLMGDNELRNVSLIEKSNTLHGCHFFSYLVPDSGSNRSAWFSALLKASERNDLVFLDPK